MKKIDLNGTWRLSDEAGDYRCAATVPGTVHGALLHEDLIPDPFYGRNEADLQWIGERGWVWERDFELSPELLAEDRLTLVCEGLDTFAEIIVNDHLVASCDNMHRTWRIDLKPAVRAGGNHLVIRCRSVMPYIRERQNERELLGPTCVAHEPKGRSWVRKEHSNFGWDWGPVLITCGIYRALHIEATSQPRLHPPLVRQRHEQDRVSLDVTAEVSDASTALRARVGLTREGTREGAVVADTLVSLDKDRGVAATLGVEQPALWWPNGLGDQPLYDLSIELIAEDDEVVARHEARIGLRTIQLQREEDTWGESFRFVVNGRPLFAKGACWIPADAVKDRIDDAVYDRLLEDAAEANMNMVRIWGGGYFEPSRFYERCDQLGLLVWHDFMFACSAYPGDQPAFREQVCQEIRDQVRRLRHHPSIALWCGNNELEMHIAKSDSEWPRMPMKWYRKLFDEAIPAVLAEEDPERDYWPCSPHTPVGNRDDHNNPDFGNAHLWAVWHGNQPFEYYRGSYHRFCTEFGFQSFPEPKTIHTFTEPEDRFINSPVMDWHQRGKNGNATILHYLMSWFPMPYGFDNTLWMSQLVQALSISYAVEHWRRNMPRCMGAVYWQLNDNWPVASWSSIDYRGNWKALHYAAKRFFAPLLLSALEDEGRQCIELHLTHDLEDGAPVSISWQLVTTAGEPIASGREASELPCNGSHLAATVDCRDALRRVGPDRLLCFAELHRDGQVAGRAWSAFRKPRALRLVAPEIKVNSEAHDDKLRLTISSDRPALFVLIRHNRHAFVADDNAFMLAPGEARQILLRPRGCTVAELSEGLDVCCLTDLIE